MSNHFHLVLRSRPDVVTAWDDTEVARRWLKLCPKRKCAAYVDLNPIRTARAETREFTSAQQRAIELRQASNQQASTCEDVNTAPKAIVRSLRPLSIDELEDDIGARRHTAGFRSSDKGFLAMSVASYLELLDWTARQSRPDKGGATPASSAPIFTHNA